MSVVRYAHYTGDWQIFYTKDIFGCYSLLLCFSSLELRIVTFFPPSHKEIIVLDLKV